MPDNKVIEKINYNGTTYEVGIQSLATSQEKGLMSPTDKMRLDNMEVSSIAGTAPISVSAPNDNGVVTISHNNSNVTANTYGTTATTALTPAFGATFSVPGFTVNALGHVTAAGAHTVKIPNTEASSGAAGLMSAADKGKLDDIAANAKNTTIKATAPIAASAQTGEVTITHATSGPSTSGNTSKGDTTNMEPAFGGTFKVTSGTVDKYGHTTAFAEHTVKIPATIATSGEDGLMSKADKANFDLGVTIAGNTIAIGGDLAANTLRTSLGLSTAMHFIGISTVAITDGSTTNPTITGYDFGTNGANAQKGDVVIDKDSAYEFVWTGSKWERLGPDGSYALSDHTHANATSGAAGFMSASDKITFDSIPATYVKKAGDTMTGGLTLTSQSSAFNNYGIVFSSGGKIGGNTSGDLGIYGNNIYLRPSSTESSSTEGIKISASDISPTTNESVSLGTSSLKYSAIYATNFYGSGANLTSLNASNLSSGTVPIARIPTGTTSSTVALGNHTHTASLATDTGTSAITLAHGGKYKLVAGGSSVIFTMPADSNTDTKVNVTSAPIAITQSYVLMTSTTPTSTATGNTALASSRMWVNAVDKGKFELVLGNATATSTSGGQFGQLALYSTGTKGTYLTAADNSAAWYTVTLPAKTGTIALTSDIVDTKVNVVARGTTKAYLLADTTTPTSTAAAHTAVAETAVYLTTTAGEINATQYKVNEKAFMHYDTTTDSIGFTFI